MIRLRQLTIPEDTMLKPRKVSAQQEIISRELNIRSLVLDQVALNMYCDVDGTIIHVNDLCCSMLNVSRFEIIGKPLHRILSGHLGSATIMSMLQHADANGTWKGFLSVKSKNEQFTAGYAVICPIRDEHNITTRFIIALDSARTPELNAFPVTQSQIDLVYNISRAHKVQKVFYQTPEELKAEHENTQLIFRSAHPISGDVYWMRKNHDQVNVIFGDATGKGVPAAFISVAVTAWIVANPQIVNQSPKKTASQINDFICTLLKKDTRDSISESIDMAVAKIDLKTRILRLTSAKTRVMILRGGELISTLQDKTSVGETSYKSSTSTSQVISLEDGDRIVFLTDGIVDQLDQSGKRFGTANFKSILRKSALLPLEQQQNYIREQIEKFRGDTAQTDDMTLLMIEI